MSALRNAAVGLFTAITQGAIAFPAYADCERYVSDTNGIRIVAFPVTGLDQAVAILVATRNGGKSWQHVIDLRYDYQADPPCENIGSLGPSQFWVWMGWKLAVTSNGGRSWRHLNLVGSWPFMATIPEVLTTDVWFDDPLNGCAQLASPGAARRLPHDYEDSSTRGPIQPPAAN